MYKKAHTAIRANPVLEKKPKRDVTKKRWVNRVQSEQPLSRWSEPSSVGLFCFSGAGGTAPSCRWHRGRTASPRKKPASYEHKNKKQGTVRGRQDGARPHRLINVFKSTPSLCLSSTAASQLNSKII